MFLVPLGFGLAAAVVAVAAWAGVEILAESAREMTESMDDDSVDDAWAAAL